MCMFVLLFNIGKSKSSNIISSYNIENLVQNNNIIKNNKKNMVKHLDSTYIESEREYVLKNW